MPANYGAGFLRERALVRLMGVARLGVPSVAFLVAVEGDEVEGVHQTAMMRIEAVLGILGHRDIGVAAVGDEALACAVIEVMEDFVGLVAIGGRWSYRRLDACSE